MASNTLKTKRVLSALGCVNYTVKWAE